MDLKKIGIKLKELRGDKTLEQVANDIGVTKSAMSNYEQGIRMPRDEIKLAIADYYKVTVTDLFFAN